MSSTVTSKIELNKNKIQKLNKATITALEKTIDALYTEVVIAQTMPFDVGTMQNSNTFADYSNSSDGKVSLITATPYARRLYFHPEYNFQTKENANAQGEWYEKWINGDAKDFCEKAFAQFYTQEAGLNG